MKIGFTLFLFFMMTCAEAQYMPVRSTMSTPRGNISTYNNVRMPTYYGSNTGVSSMKTTYQITLKNDSSFSIKSAIDMKSRRHRLNYKVKGKKQIIFPSDTKSISCVEAGGLRYKGIPADTCWLFNANYGKINTYNYLPGKDNRTIAAIQEGDSGPLLKITKENVLKMVKENSEAVKLAEEGKLLKAIAKFNGWGK